MQSDLHDKLAAVDLFSGLSKRQLKRLAGGGKVISHPEGKVVAAEGEGALAFHLVLEGEFDVTVHGKHVARLAAGDFFGEISMIDGKPRSATVTAVTPASCFAVPHASFASLVETEPQVAGSLLVALAGRVREADGRL